MEIFKNKWFWVTTTIVFIAMLCEFYNCIIYNYPLWVKTQINLINKPDSKVTPLEMGTYGDMYGALNTLFSGLAFLGLLVTIGVQLWLYYREQESKKEEKRDKASNKLVYLNLLVNQSFSEIEAFKEGIKALKEKNSFEKKRADFFTDDNTIGYNKINHIVNEIDQEAFFTAYYQEYKEENLIDLFVLFGKIFKSWQSFIGKLRGYEVECDSELFKLSRAYNILQEKDKEASKSLTDPNKNGTSVESNSLEMRKLLSVNSDIDILGVIGKKDHLFEIYYTIKDKYESQIEKDKDAEAVEINEYLQNCKESIENIEDIKVEILHLCRKQIIEIALSEGSIKKIRIKES